MMLVRLSLSRGDSVYKTTFKACLLFSALMSSSAIYAAGLGKLTVSSALGQVFKAEIDLVSVKKEEIPTLAVRLASPDAFREANIDFTSFLSTLKLSMDVRADGQPYVRITSSQPVNDPFVNMLVELDSSSGRLTREYTVLLDPPDAGKPATAAAQPEVVAPVVAPAPIAPVAETQSLAPASQSAEVDPVKPEAALPPVSESAPVPVAKEHAAELKVKRGDTLYRLARNVAPPGVDLNQMLIALYRANPDAFAGNNINRLKTGRIMQIPDSSQVDTISASEASKEIKVQMADWHGYQQKLAGVAGAASPVAESLKQSASGKITATVEDHAGANELPKEEVLKLSKGGEGAGKDVKGQTAARIRAMEEDATAKAKALKEANERVALLEKNIEEMKQLLELKNSAMADAQKHAETASQPASPVADKPAAGTAPEVKADVKTDTKREAQEEPETTPPESKPAATPPAPVAAKPKPAAAPLSAPAPVEEEPSIVDMLMENIQLVGGALAALLLGLLGYSMAQRKKKTLEADLDGNEDTGNGDTDSTDADSVAEPISPAEEKAAPAAAETSQESVAAVAATDNNVSEESAADTGHEEVDPVAEADIYLNYGRDAQAEKTLTDALAKTPDYPEVLAKLLEVYALRKDTGAFKATALSLQALSPAAPLWEKAVKLGLALDPENPLYGGEPAVIPDAASAAEPLSTLVQDTLQSDMPGEIQFDTSDLTVHQESGLTARSEADHADNMIEFPAISTDFSSQTAGGDTLAAAYVPTGSDGIANEIVFDTGIESVAADAAAENAPVEIIKPAVATQLVEREVIQPAGGMEFSFDGDLAGKSESASPGGKGPGLPPLESSMAEIDLNLDEVGSAGQALPETEDKSPLWYEVATKIDLARAYQEMGDDEGAREILQEVLREGDAGQQETAQMILASM